MVYELIVCLPLSIKFRFMLKKINNNNLFILGNGPSLQDDLFKIKKGSLIFAVNTFFSKNYFKSYKPSFLCCIDFMFWSDYSRLSPSVKKPVQKTFKELNRITWDLTVFIPNGAKKTFKSRINNKNIKIITIPALSYDFELSLYLKILCFFKLPPPRINVVVTSLYIGILYRINNIELLGVDMDRIYSFKVNQVTNKSYINYIHFSNTKTQPLKFKNKFIDRKETSIYIKLIREASAFKWYAYIALLSKSFNIKLKNKSYKSLVDSIDR